MNVYLLIEDTFRGDFAEPLEDLFTLVYKNHTVLRNWTIPSMGDILTGYQDNGLSWEWHKDDIKDEDLIIKTLKGKLSKKTIAEYLSVKCNGSIGGNFVQAAYGFDRGFDRWQEAPFGFMESDTFDEEAKNSFTLFHQYYIHDYFVDAEWDILKMKQEKFKNITQDQITRGIDCYKNRVLVLKDKLRKFLDLHPNDIFILTADHGEAFGEHENSYHHGVYSLMHEEIYRVPLMIKLPTGNKKTITQLTRSIDIVPTILSIFNVPIWKFPGMNLLKMADGKNYNLSASSNFFYDGDKYKFTINNSGSSFKKI